MLKKQTDIDDLAGDPQLKFLLQWMACSAQGRRMIYFPFGDVRMHSMEKALSVP